MNLVTLSMAKAYTDSQRLAYSTSAFDIAFDGDATGKLIILRQMVRVYDKAIDFSQVETIEMYWGGTNGSVPVEEITVNKADDISWLMNDDVPFALSIATPTDFGDGTIAPIGTYFMYSPGNGWVSRIAAAETIHPIDPKYLPKMVDVWEVSGVHERQVNDSHVMGVDHKEDYSGNFTELLNRVRLAVESGWQFIAHFPSENFYATLTGYSDSCVSFTSCYTDTANSYIVNTQWVFGSDGKLRSACTKVTI